MSRIILLVAVFNVASGTDLVSHQRNVTTRIPNTRIKRDVKQEQSVFSVAEKSKFLQGVSPSKLKCEEFFLGGEMPTGISEGNRDIKYICQRYKDHPYFATQFNLGTKTADYSAYKPYIGNNDRPAWSDLYEHGFYDYDKDKKIQYYGIDTRSARKRFPYSAVAEKQGTDRTYRGGLTFKIERGHLNPSGINSIDQNKMKATLTYTNLVPQFSDLNQEAWRRAEFTIRDFISRSKRCDPKKTYLLTGTVPSEMYLGYDNVDDPQSDHPQLCKKKNPNCNIRNKVNIPAYMWTAGACDDGSGNCKTFSVLAKNDGHENAVGFYKLQTLEKFLGAKSLVLSTCWINHKEKESDRENTELRSEQKDQVLHDFPNDVPVTLFPGCKTTADFSKEFDKHFKNQAWSHFLHSHISTLVETKRQQLLKKIKAEETNYKDQNVLILLDNIYKAIKNLDNIVDSDLISEPVPNCELL